MTDIQCERCGHAFDTERETVAPGQDTRRCPQCGAKAGPDADAVEAVGDGGQDAQVTTSGSTTITITIEIEPENDD